MIIVSYFTKNTPYQHELIPFQENMKDLGLRAMVYQVENQGSWELNCAMKPQVIDWAMEDFPDDDILFLDIDAVVKRQPVVEDLRDDMPGIAKVRSQVASGTIYFPQCKASQDLVSVWLGMQKVRGKVWDQRVLQEVLEKTDIPYFQLPPTWIAIQHTYKIPNPIILHMQASRDYKHEINQTRPHSLTSNPSKRLRGIRGSAG